MNKLIIITTLIAISFNSYSQDNLDKAYKDMEEGYFLITKMEELSIVNNKIDSYMNVIRGLKDRKSQEFMYCATREFVEKKILILNELIESEIILEDEFNYIRNDAIEQRAIAKMLIEVMKPTCK